MPKNIGSKTCPKCLRSDLSGDDFTNDASKPSGKKSHCKQCVNKSRRVGDDGAQAPADVAADQVIAHTDRAGRTFAKEQAADAERAAASRRRLASDHAALRPEDFATAVANDDPRDPKVRALNKQAAKEKRQEFSQRMGDHMAAVHTAAIREKGDGGNVLEHMPGETGEYIGALAEQERRFGNRRLARSISLFAAGEELQRRLFIATAKQYFRDRVVPVGYAKKPNTTPIKRSVCLLLSDLHLGADLSPIDNPTPFGPVEEARRLEYILRQVMDYKPQYRKHSELVLLWNGDLIEGLLLHDLVDGAPLAEQKAILLRHAMTFIGQCAMVYPRVRNFWKPGNHGRNKLRHPGRATSKKWDGEEWALGFALQMATSSLKNVEWELDAHGVLNRQPHSVVDLHGSYVGLTHGDTELKIGDPDTKAVDNLKQLLAINSTRRYGVEFAAWLFGHYHKGRQHLGDGMRVLYNPCLLPPNGHARTSGYGESCGQWLFEAVPGFPIGDTRLIEVGRAQDNDERLGSLIKPFRFDLV